MDPKRILGHPEVILVYILERPAAGERFQAGSEKNVLNLL